MKVWWKAIFAAAVLAGGAWAEEEPAAEDSAGAPPALPERAGETAPAGADAAAEWRGPSEEAVAWDGDMEAEVARANGDGAQGDAWREELQLASPVMDYAGLLGREDRLDLIDKIRAGMAGNGSQLVLVTAPSLRGGDPRDFATRLFAQWGVGEKGKDNGVLFLLAVEERRVEIEVGAGMEGALPDAKCGRLLDRAVVPALRKDDWKAGIFGGTEALLAVMAGEDFDTAVGRGESTMGTILKWGVIAGFIGIPLWAMFKGRRKDGDGGGDDGNGGGGIDGVPGGGFAGGARPRGGAGMRMGPRRPGGFRGGGGMSRGGGAGRGF